MLRLRLARTYLFASGVFTVLSVGYGVIGIGQILSDSIIPGLCFIASAIIYALLAAKCYRRYNKIVAFARYEP